MAASIEHNKALIIITDALYDLYTTNHDFVPRLKELIPYFRRNDADIIWVRTQWPEVRSEEPYTVDKAGNLIVTNEYHNSALNRTPQEPQIHSELLDMVDEAKDLIVTKDLYSAFERTSLLEALRKKMIFEVYFCGWLVNVGISDSVIDAGRYGLNVTVIEDCVGFRSKEKYEEAMSNMVEIIGTDVVDSEGLINMLGGVPVPDIDTALYQLSLNIAENTIGNGDL